MFLKLTRITDDGLEEPILVHINHIEAVRPSPAFPTRNTKIHFARQATNATSSSLPTVIDVIGDFATVSKLLVPITIPRDFSD